MDVFVQGKNRLTLTQAEFKADGGEGAVYVKGSTAYKIYHDPVNAIPLKKIQELSCLSDPDIIRPLDPLMDASGTLIGYTMRAIPTGMPLIQTFTKAFRLREGLTPDKVVPLVTKLRTGVQHVHDKRILIVDLNEMNFLVDPAFRQMYFIDVDSYQTSSYKARVLMESVRDRHCPNHNWSEGTDWFSFGIVTFQMFVGIHPFKGEHPKITGLNNRMLANISVLNPEVETPAAMLPFDVIPNNFREWYRAVFDKGMRIAPPTGPLDVIVISPVFQVKHQAGSNQFDIVEIGVFGTQAIVRATRGYVMTTEGLYLATRRLDNAPTGAQLAFTPAQGHAVLAWIDQGNLRLQNATLRQEITNSLSAEAITTVGGRIILKQGDRLQEVEFTEIGGRVIVTARHIGNVLEQATQVFDGVVIQKLLGACWASLFPRPFACEQIRLRELEPYRVIDAKLEGNVLMVVGEQKGKYDQFVIRFAADWGSYDVRVIPDITYTGLNFTVLDSGICVHMNPSEKLELFQAKKDALAIREIDDAAVRGDIRLLHQGAQTLFARGNTLYSISLKKQP